MTKEQIKKHKIAAEKLNQIKNRAFRLIRKNIGKVSEYEVSQFILSEFKKQGLVTEKKHPFPIVAVNKNTSVVHHFPKKQKVNIISNNSLVMLDIWARLKEKNAPFADITWMGYAGKNVPKEIEKAFTKVVKVQNTALNFIKKNLKSRQLPKTKIVDKIARDYFKKYGLEKNFLHGLGHSLGIRECHGKYFRFGKKSQAELKTEIPFTIEPGLYFKGKFGIRCEMDCYVTKDYKLVITTKVQKQIIKI